MLDLHRKYHPELEETIQKEPSPLYINQESSLHLSEQGEQDFKHLYSELKLDATHDSQMLKLLYSAGYVQGLKEASSHT